MTRNCATPGCRRSAIKDGRDCADHLPRWIPEWRKRALADAEQRGRVAVKEVAS